MAQPTQMLKDRLAEITRDETLIEGQLRQHGQLAEALKAKLVKVQQDKRDLENAIEKLR
jgi:hypothetical protein